jgi:hypothetical protein
VKAFRRATIIKRVWMFAGLIAVLGIPFWWLFWSRHKENEKREQWRKEYEAQTFVPPAPVLPPTPPADLLPAAEQTELAKQARAFELKLGESIASWETLTATNVLAKTKAGSEPCPFAISPPPKAAADAFIETGANDPRDFTSSDFMGYLAKDEVIPAEALYDYERNLKQVIGQLDNGTATARTKERWAAIREPFTFVVIDRVQARSRRRPRVHVLARRREACLHRRNRRQELGARGGSDVPRWRQQRVGRLQGPAPGARGPDPPGSRGEPEGRGAVST